MKKIMITTEHIDASQGHSSKGNQLKWKQDDWWYKADAFGYESLAEVVVSHLLIKSTIQEQVLYEPVLMQKGEQTLRGCTSKEFKNKNQELITLEHLSRAYTSTSLSTQLSYIFDVEKQIHYTVELVENITGIDDFGRYLTGILEMDAFFFNEDRHTNNIALLYDTKEKTYQPAPYFDMGLSLFSDTREAFPLSYDFLECEKRIEAKPFSRDFDEQLDAANVLYGQNLRFHFSGREMEKEVDAILEQYQVVPDQEDGYQAGEIERVKDTLRFQARKYGYLFQT